MFAPLQALLATLFIALAAYGAGIWLRPILPATFSRSSQIVSTWIGGAGAIGVALFVVGQWSFGRATIGTVLAIGLGFAVIRIVREPLPVTSSRWRSAMPPGSAIPLAIVGLVLAITAVGGLAEPIGDFGTDGVAYHYAGPKVWLRDDIVRPLPDNAPTAYPAANEMVFAALMEFGGPRAPALSSAMTFALFLAVCVIIARRCGLDVAGAWWVAALVAAMPAVYRGAYAGFIDVFYAAIVLAAACVAFDANRRRHFVAVGAFCGLAMATKYTGLLVVAPLVVCALWPARRERFGEILARAGVAAATAALVAAPMYFRNWWLLGSPIYPPPPGLSDFFPVKYMSTAAVREFYAYNAQRGFGHGRGILSFLALPFNLTYHTADFNGAGGIGLGPLALGPLGLVAARHNGCARRLAAFALLLTVIWFFTMQEARFLIQAYVAAAIFAVIGWQHVRQRAGARGRALSDAVVALSVIYGLGLIAGNRASDMRAALSPAFAAERRAKEVPFIDSLDFVNGDAAVTKVVLLDPLITGYFSDRGYIKPFGQYGEQALIGAATPHDVLCRLHTLGVSHVIDVRSRVSDFRVGADHAGLELVFERPGQRVYRVGALTPTGCR